MLICIDVCINSVSKLLLKNRMHGAPSANSMATWRLVNFSAGATMAKQSVPGWEDRLTNPESRKSCKTERVYRKYRLPSKDSCQQMLLFYCGNIHPFNTRNNIFPSLFLTSNAKAASLLSWSATPFHHTVSHRWHHHQDWKPRASWACDCEAHLRPIPMNLVA